MGKAAKAEPLEAFATKGRGAHPVPLKSASYVVDIRGALASVTMSRTFRNDEDRPIEATVTFPVPFDAAVFSIEAIKDGQTLIGRAAAKAKARESYEDAVDRGKPAVLHEELLRGLHMLSVANLAPGSEVEVRATFAVPISLDGTGGGSMRIPLTLGQVYGPAPLADSDAPAHGGPVLKASVKVSSEKGTVTVNGGALEAGVATVDTDRPVEVAVAGIHEPGKELRVEGLAADGSKVRLSFSAQESGDRALAALLLLDVSGSMKERVSSSGREAGTKWDAVVNGLSDASGSDFTARDSVEVWTFSSGCRRVGECKGNGLAAFMRTVPFASGGTELANAVATVTGSRREADVLLITDGRSWTPIDVQAAVATGARFTVVLIGEAALESSVGYLAAMTGGRMFVALRGDVRGAVAAAAVAMRSAGLPVSAEERRPEKLERAFGGTRVTAAWEKGDNRDRQGFEAAVGAWAAFLAVQCLPDAEAAKLAEEEGLVTHLTSIFLVDEAAEASEAIPATRKVALSTPATAVVFEAMAAGPAPVMRSYAVAAPAHLVASGAYAPVHRSLKRGGPVVLHGSGGVGFGDVWSGGGMYDDGLTDASQPHFDRPFRDDGLQPVGSAATRLGDVLAYVDWDAAPDKLAAGNLDGQSIVVRAAVAMAATQKEVIALAQAAGCSAEAAAVALLARVSAGTSRTASRIARSVLKGVKADVVEAAAKAVGL